tara:strand:- start:755 stop:955 length:201 start_codon:yes stop_codon:yes gene_type:complete
MKIIKLLLGVGLLLVCGVSCETINAGAGVAVPFTDNGSGSPVRVALDVNAKLLPPKFCIGLDVVGE